MLTSARRPLPGSKLLLPPYSQQLRCGCQAPKLKKRLAVSNQLRATQFSQKPDLSQPLQTSSSGCPAIGYGWLHLLPTIHSTHSTPQRPPPVSTRDPKQDS